MDGVDKLGLLLVHGTISTIMLGPQYDLNVSTEIILLLIEFSFYVQLK